MKIIHIKNLDTFLNILTKKKQKELRRLTNFFSSIEIGEEVIIRWTSHTVICKIIGITKYSTLDDVFDDVDFKNNTLVPDCHTREDGIQKYMKYYSQKMDDNTTFIMFDIEIN